MLFASRCGDKNGCWEVNPAGQETTQNDTALTVAIIARVARACRVLTMAQRFPRQTRPETQCAVRMHLEILTVNNDCESHNAMLNGGCKFSRGASLV